MTGEHDYYQSELNFKEILSVFSVYRKSILLTPLLFTAIALLISWFFITPLYQAFVTIEIGQVNGRLIEEGSVVEERMRDRSFISNVIATHKDIFKYEKNLSAEESFLQKTLQVKKSKDAINLISFDLLGSSREVALEKANAVFETLKSFHDGVFNSNLRVINEQIKLIDDQIILINKDRLRRGSNIGNLNPYYVVIDSLVLQDQVRQLRDLQNQKIALTMSLSSALTYNTQVLGSIWVSQEPITPNYQATVLIALALGFFIALFAAFLRRALSD